MKQHPVAAAQVKVYRTGYIQGVKFAADYLTTVADISGSASAPGVEKLLRDLADALRSTLRAEESDSDV